MVHISLSDTSSCGQPPSPPVSVLVPPVSAPPVAMPPVSAPPELVPPVVLPPELVPPDGCPPVLLPPVGVAPPLMAVPLVLSVSFELSELEQLRTNNSAMMAVADGSLPQPAADRVRLERMFAVHHATVGRLLRRRGLSPDAAADATQQTSLVASERLADIDPDSERSLLIGTALRVAHTLRRKTIRWQLDHDMDQRVAMARDAGEARADIELCDLARHASALHRPVTLLEALACPLLRAIEVMRWLLEPAQRLLAVSARLGHARPRQRTGWSVQGNSTGLKSLEENEPRRAMLVRGGHRKAKRMLAALTSTPWEGSGMSVATADIEFGPTHCLSTRSHLS
jgi:DNA-directed RNA polymerase specialized sigma24 family protein